MKLVKHFHLVSRPRICGAVPPNIVTHVSKMHGIPINSTSTILPILKQKMFKRKSLYYGTHRCGIVEFSYFLLMIVRLEKTKHNN